MNSSKGVSTFVNKVIPGRGDLNKAAASSNSNNLSKNSLGYHLLERKKSLDESSSNSNDRYAKSHFAKFSFFVDFDKYTY